jgi:hypothetical protein
MNVEAICPVCFASNVVSAELRGKKYYCESCEEPFIVNWKSKTTSKKRTKRVSEAESPPVTVLPTNDEPPVVRPYNPPVAKLIPLDDPEPVAVPQPTAVPVPVPTARPVEVEVVDEPEVERKPEKKKPRDLPATKKKVKKAKSRGVPVLVILGIAGGAFVLLMVAGMGGWWAWKRWHANSTVLGPGPTAPVDDRPERNNPPPDVAPDTRREDPKGDSRRDPPKVAPAGWKAKADPPASKFVVRDLKQPIKVGGTIPTILFPTQSSPFVALTAGPQEIQVWDLEKGTQSGKVLQRLSAATVPPVLSPDGEYLAMVSTEHPGKVDVCFVGSVNSTSTTLKTIKVSPTLAVDYLDFCAPGKLLTCHSAAGKKLYEVWHVQTGKREHEVEGPDFFDRDALAISPGGKYLALAGIESVTLYELESGAQAGRLDLPKVGASRSWICRGLSFSPDGASLAGIFRTTNGAKASLLSWDVSLAFLHGDYELTTEGRAPASLTTTYRGHAIDWVGEQEGWLLYGTYALDHDGKRVGTFTPAKPDEDAGPRRLIGPAHIAVPSLGAGGSHVLQLEPFRLKNLK